MHKTTLILSIAKRLKRLRQKQGLKQTDFSARAGLSNRHYQKLEAGEIDFRMSVIAKLASALKICPDHLLSDFARCNSESCAEYQNADER